MLHIISTDSPPELTLCENNEIASILQNVYLIMTTRLESVPMYRSFGLSMKFIDKPTAVAETLLASELREAIDKFEPRAKLIDIAYEPSALGTKLKAKIEV